jgi:hypothetical protein
MITYGGDHDFERPPSPSSFLSMCPDGWDLRELGAIIDAGALEMRIDSTCDFDRAAEAFARVETRRAKGKVVVEMGTQAGWLQAAALRPYSTVAMPLERRPDRAVRLSTTLVREGLQ